MGRKSNEGGRRTKSDKRRATYSHNGGKSTKHVRSTLAKAEYFIERKCAQS